jgi:hypothetical protein
MTQPEKHLSSRLQSVAGGTRLRAVCHLPQATSRRTRQDIEDYYAEVLKVAETVRTARGDREWWTPDGRIPRYSAGKCRCEHCKAAYAIYRAECRASGKDSPRGIRVVDTDGRIPRRWFRDNVWLKAREAARLGVGVKVHGLRHPHSSWLLAGGGRTWKPSRSDLIFLRRERW